MKRVSVRLFAAFREAAGESSLSLDTEAATPAELFSEVCERCPGLRLEAASLVAVNDQMADWESPIVDGDEVLFFPPVAGG